MWVSRQQRPRREAVNAESHRADPLSRERHLLAGHDSRIAISSSIFPACHAPKETSFIPETSAPRVAFGEMSPFVSVPETEWFAANNLAFAIYDRYPVNDGHVLVITRRQIPTWWDATPEEQQAIFQLVEVVKRLLDEQFQPAGYNVGFNAGEVAGQTVPHLHVHVIPRYVGDMDDPTGGVRHVIPWKGNYKATETWPPDPPSAASAAAAAPSLVLPRNNRLHSALTTCLANPAYDRIDLVISFVMWSGVELMKDHLQAALDRGVHLRLLTSDYLLTTDVNALGF